MPVIAFQAKGGSKADALLANEGRSSKVFVTSLQNLISLTDDQTQDIITIRRVYMTKRASLDEQRKAVVEEMGRYEQQCLHPADTVVALSALAEQIRDISAQDFKAYCAVISGFYQGVRIFIYHMLSLVMLHGLLCLAFHNSAVKHKTKDPDWFSGSCLLVLVHHLFLVML